MDDASDVQETRHESVLLTEAVDALCVHAGGVYLDCTLGGGGYTDAILEKLDREGGAGLVIALDQDPAAIARARKRFGNLPENRLRLVHANFAGAADVLDAEGVTCLDGAVMDLGLSSDQLDDPARGFSFESNAVPDMRMNPGEGRTAAEIVNEDDEAELARILKEYGEEPKARVLARRIVAARPITSCKQLADLARGLYRGKSRMHPATRLFQALRIVVNDELGALQAALEAIAPRLAPGGRFAVVSFHSLEDRVVKQYFVSLCEVEKNLVTGQPLSAPAYRLVSRKSISPSEAEMEKNPRARSARLRVLERAAA